MTTAWEPERYHDTYRERVEELIDQKRQGTVVVSDGPRAEPAPVVDLLAALQASVSAARGRSGAALSGETGEAQKQKEHSTAARRQGASGRQAGRGQPQSDP